MIEKVKEAYFRYIKDRFVSANTFRILEQRTLADENVVSFSLFGKSRRYLDGALLNIERYKLFFPEFVCRFYISRDLPLSFVEELQKENCELCIMDAEGIDLTYTFWRFLAADDINKKIFLIRDIDSAASEQERTLYEEWLASGYQFNIIRSHYSHNTRIMAGMWGGKTKKDFIKPTLKHIWRFKNQYERDQKFLAKVIYPKIIENCHVQDIIKRFDDEEPSLIPVDEQTYSFMGEIATDDDLRNEWRKEFKRLHLEHKKGNSGSDLSAAMRHHQSRGK